MLFTREGLTLMLVLLAVAVLAFALALARRSWPLWLLGLGITVASLVAAYTHRADAVVAGPAGSSGAVQ